MNSIINDSECSLLIDDFTGSETILFTKVAGQEINPINPCVGVKIYEDQSSTPFVYLGITFEMHEKFGYIKLFQGLVHKPFCLSKGEELIFLFEDGTKITQLVKSNSIIELSEEILITFIQKSLKKVKHTSKNKYTIYHFNHSFHKLLQNQAQYQNDTEGAYLLRLLAYKFAEALFRFGKAESSNLGKLPIGITITS